MCVKWIYRSGSYAETQVEDVSLLQLFDVAEVPVAIKDLFLFFFLKDVLIVERDFRNRSELNSK